MVIRSSGRNIGGVSGVSFSVIGLNKALSNINSIVARKQEYVKKQISIAAINVQRDSKRNAPVDTGRLRASIRFSLLNSGYSAIVFSDVKYARFQEFGTRRMRGRFYMTNAWKAEEPELLKRLKKGFRNP